MSQKIRQLLSVVVFTLYATAIPFVEARTDSDANWGTYANTSTLGCNVADCGGGGTPAGTAGTGEDDDISGIGAGSVINNTLGSAGIVAGFIPLGPGLENMFFSGNATSTAQGISEGVAKALGLYHYSGPDISMTVTLSMSANFNGPLSGAQNDIDGARVQLLIFTDTDSISQINNETGANLSCLFDCYTPNEQLNIVKDSGLSNLSDSVSISLTSGDQFYLYGQANIAAAGGGDARIINKADIDFSSTEGLTSVPVGVNQPDADNDSVPDVKDNCTFVLNVDQRDTNGDGYGNLCDPDINNDGIVNFLDVADWVPFFKTATSGDEDFNGDGVVNFLDFAVLSEYFLNSPGPSGIAP